MRSVFLALMLSSCILKAQITVDMNDFAGAGELVVYSELSPPFSVDPVPSDSNYFWDFSMLQDSVQRIDTVFAVSSMPGVYSLFFADLGFNPNKANLAMRGSLPPVPGIAISDVYNFFHNSASQYVQAGYGATVNGLQLPVAYGNKDVIYSFPLNYGDADTSYSDVSVSLPGMGSLNTTQVRTSYVDGWGMVSTPFGTFDCIRQVSVVMAHDSIYVDSLAMGFAFDRIPVKEYKWLAKNMDGPVLQINTQELLPGTESVTAVFFRDSIHTTVIEKRKPDYVTAFPNPAAENVNFHLSGRNPFYYTIVAADGRVIAKHEWVPAKDVVFSYPARQLKEGIYIVTFENENEIFRSRFVVRH